MLMGFTLQPVPFPGVSLALLGRTIHPGQQGGLHVMRDIPRYVKLIERGVIDAQSVITKRYTLDQSRQAVQDTADRTIITGVIEFCSSGAASAGPGRLKAAPTSRQGGAAPPASPCCRPPSTAAIGFPCCRWR